MNKSNFAKQIHLILSNVLIKNRNYDVKIVLNILRTG